MWNKTEGQRDRDKVYRGSGRWETRPGLRDLGETNYRNPNLQEGGPHPLIPKIWNSYLPFSRDASVEESFPQAGGCAASSDQEFVPSESACPQQLCRSGDLYINSKEANEKMNCILNHLFNFFGNVRKCWQKQFLRISMVCPFSEISKFNCREISTKFHQN